MYLYAQKNTCMTNKVTCKSALRGLNNLCAVVIVAFVVKY